MISLLFISLQTFGQAGDISQIRNGSGKTSQQGVLDTCGSCWVNGNAGSTNAHYVEGMSIAYRSLLTGLTPGVCYEYELGYDTYHGAMAIDYLTHFQRLQPHGPFNHNAEVINPLVLVNGSTEYVFQAGNTDTYPIPAPAPSGITSGAFTQNGTPKDISNQAITSFNALPAGERVMTIYDGDITFMYYVSQSPLVIGGADAETKVRIRFMANNDSVILAWGGHIASRLDWGYSKDSKGKLTPLSAGGISGSPYHMRQKAFDRVECNVNPSPTILQSFSGFGNTDRSLSAAAVVPPPECPTVPSQTICLESSFSAFTIASPQAGTTYTWSFGTNSVGATFVGGVNTGNTINVAHAGTSGGSFTLDITASLNGIQQPCTGVATGTVINVQVDAQDADNALQLNLNVSGSIALGIESISPGTTADYDFQWKLVSKPASANSSFTNATSANATFNVLSPFAIGVYTVRVIATQKVSPFCKDSSDVTIDVSGGVNCGVGGPAPVCPGSQDNVYFYDSNSDGIADAIPANFTALWSFVGTHPSAEFDGSLTGNTVKVDVAALGSSCNTSYTVKITLTPTSALFTVPCSKTVSVADTEAPVITVCPTDQNLECGASTDPDDIGTPTFTDNCSATASKSDATVSNCNTTVITRTWTVTDLCGNTATCVQLIVIKDTEAPQITCLNDGNITVIDNCSAPADIITYSKVVNGVRKWTAVDASGNTSIMDCPLPIQARITNNAVSEKVIHQNVGETVVQSKVSSKKGAINAATLQVKAFPNPFTNKVTFRFSSPESGKAMLEVYNALGQKLGVVYEGMVKAGVVQDVQYDVKKTNNATLIFKLRVNNKTVNGKLNQLN